MSEKVTAMIEEIKGLTVLELSELVHALEEEFGVSAAAMAAPAAGAAAPAAEEKTEFDVVLAGFDAAQKIKVIKSSARSPVWAWPRPRRLLRSSHHSEGSPVQGRCRDHEEGSGGRWRQGRAEVIFDSAIINRIDARERLRKEVLSLAFVVSRQRDCGCATSDTKGSHRTMPVAAFFVSKSLLYPK